MNEIDRLTEMIEASKSIVFFGGAGVSTESGIPDFRSEGGAFEAIARYGASPEELLSHSFFLRDTETFYRYYRQNLARTGYKPNSAHTALAKLEEMGKLTAVVTQNIDGLHQMAGSKKVFELHGSIYRNYCMRCKKSYGIEAIEGATGVPKCECGGVIRPDVVLYEEPLDADVITAAIRAIMRADMLIIGGTSLVVYPAASLIEYYNGEKLVLINKSTTPYDNRANLVIHQPIGTVLKAAVERI